MSRLGQNVEEINRKLGCLVQMVLLWWVMVAGSFGLFIFFGFHGRTNG